MPSFTKGGLAKTPFGVNRYLRSTRSCQFTSYTVAASSIPYEIIDGSPQKLLQPGTVMAKITSGPESGKVGPFQAAGTAAVQTLTPTAVTAGTFTLKVTRPVDGATATTGPIAWNATQATVLAALNALSVVRAGDIAVGGAATVNAGAMTFTFFGEYEGVVTLIVVDTTNLTATSLVMTTSTAGVAGAADGRQTTTNIVGFNDTFLPWQTMDRDVEISVLYAGTVVQAWCFELNAAGARIACQNATATAMFAQKGMDILFV